MKFDDIVKELQSGEMRVISMDPALRRLNDSLRAEIDELRTSLAKVTEDAFAAHAWIEALKDDVAALEDKLAAKDERIDELIEKIEGRAQGDWWNTIRK